MSESIFLVEDDVIIASGLKYALEQAGYSVTHAKDITTAKRDTGIYDLAILDVGLPDGSGFDLIDGLRSKGVSILFLTAVDDEGNIIRAFESGADDYVTKPFRLGELIARVKAALRRRGGQAENLTLGQVTVNPAEGKAYISGIVLDVTALEYRLLLTFINNKNQVLTREQILSQIWDSAGIFVEDNTLTVYIKRLRDKLGDAMQIETVRGIGYRAIGN
ncbi:MAG: response regulator transcription factor [Defluviitaleaceae bacterium]|nr:response regulator transcription factor [Defluviitaleaceae bacterium]